MKQQNKKRGFISFEWVIITSLMLIFFMPVIYQWLPTQVQLVVNSSINDMSKFLTGSGKVPDFSGNPDIYPSKPDEWTPDTVFTYSESGGVITITGFQNTAEAEKELVIPKTIQDKPVVSIAANAFTNKGLTKVLLPDGITTIGARAFQGNKIVSLTLPNSVTSVGAYAFQSNEITLLSLSNKITVIAEYCFAQNNITRLSIPGSITTIGTGAFATNRLSTIDIPDTVATIGADAFKQNILTKVIVGSAVNTIGDGAFTDQDVNKGEISILGANETSKARFDSRWANIFKVRNGLGNEYIRLK